ncbi:MAG: response regulator [Prolixibacteraceae bacterium]
MVSFPNWAKKTILVVEDEEVNRFFFETALKMTKVNLLFAETGWEGISMAQKHQNIDCVLMDIRLPGIDGYEATRHIKAERKNLPIIVQTAYALSNDRAKAFESGCDEFLSKPIRLGNLFEVLAKYMDD